MIHNAVRSFLIVSTIVMYLSPIVGIVREHAVQPEIIPSAQAAQTTFASSFIQKETENGAVFEISNGLQVTRFSSSSISHSLVERETLHTTSFDVQFEGANNVIPRGLVHSPVRFQQLQPHGAATKQLPTFTSIQYDNAWDGIDILIEATRGEIKTNYIIHPGADPRNISLAYAGVDILDLTPEGDLVVTAGKHSFLDRQPYTYQDREGEKEEIRSSYALLSSTRVSFAVGSYDRTRDLIIDPFAFIFGGEFSGDLATSVADIAVDSSGNIFLSGASISVSADPTGGLSTAGSFFPTKLGTTAPFLAKVLADGTGLEWVTFIPGNNTSFFTGPTPVIDVDGDGNVYIAGSVAASGGLNGLEGYRTFGPTVSPCGAFYLAFPPAGVCADAYIMKIDPTGTSLLYAGYYGPLAVYEVTVDDTGRAFIAGVQGPALISGGGGANPDERVFPDGDPNGDDVFPIGVPGFDQTYNDTGITDGVLLGIHATPNTDPLGGLAYASYFGGTAEDDVSGVDFDADGNIYLTGFTESDETSWPDASNPLTALLLGSTISPNPSSSSPGVGEGFVLKLDPTGLSVIYAGFIGGTGGEDSWNIIVGDDGSAYIVGNNGSTSATFFPSVVGGFGPTSGGGVMVKTSPSGSSYEYGGFLPTSVRDMVVDQYGQAYVLPRTGVSSDLEISVISADGSVVEEVLTLTSVGTHNTHKGIDIDALGNLYVTGNAFSPHPGGFPTSPGFSSRPVSGGSVGTAVSVVVAKLQMLKDLSLTMTSDPEPLYTGQEVTYTITVTNNETGLTSNDTTVVDTLPAGATFVSATPSQGSCSETAGILTCNFGNVAAGASPTITVTVIPTSPGTFLNSATVSSAHTDPVTADNTDSVSLTITNLDIAFALASSNISESSTPASVELVQSTISPIDTAVDYTVTGGTASSGSDYVLANGTKIIPAGSTTATIGLSVINDLIPESLETVIITLSNPQDAILGSTTVHTLSILDNDVAPLPRPTSVDVFGLVVDEDLPPPSPPTPPVVAPPAVTPPIVTPPVTPPPPPSGPDADIVQILLTTLSTIGAALMFIYATGLFVGAGTAVASGFGFGVYALGAVGIYILYLFTEPLRALLGGKKSNYGVVYNALSKQPVDLAIVRLFDAEGKLLKTRITDKKGRFIFLLDKDEKVHLTVTKAGFTFPDTLLHGVKEDSAYDHLYYGKEMEIKAEEAIIPNIPIDAPEIDGSTEAFNRRRAKQRLGKLFSMIGGFVALITAILYPSPLTIGLVILHIALYFLFARLSHGKRPTPWGVTTDKETQSPLPATIGRIFDKQYNRLLDMTQSDAQGRYSFLADKSVFYATFEHEEYISTQTPTIDLTRSKSDDPIKIDIAMERGEE